MQGYVSAYFDSFQRKLELRRVEGQLRVVIVSTQMTEPNIAKIRSEIVCQELSCLTVAQVACSGGNSPFQMPWITTVLQHLFVVVALNHQVICLADIKTPLHL